MSTTITDRSTWSVASSRRCVRGRSVRRNGRDIGLVRWCSLIGVRCPTRPRIGGVERRVYALVASLPFCGAQTAHFSFDMTIESFLEGHVRVVAWLGGVPRECVYDNLKTAVAKRDSRQVIRWNQRFLHLQRPLRVSLHRLHAGYTAGKGIGRGCGALSEDRVLACPALSDLG